MGVQGANKNSESVDLMLTEGSTQHETLLVVSPGSRALRTLSMYTEFTKKKVFEQLMLAIVFPLAAVLPVEKWELQMWRIMEES